MTLNDLQRRNSPYFAFFTNSTDFQVDYITVVEENVRKILYPSSSLPLLAKTITHPAARSLCDSWASCYTKYARNLLLYFNEIHLVKLGMRQN